MNEIFSPFLDRFVVVYLDDILIYSETPQKHEEHLRKVLDVLEKHKFYCKMKKCSFFKTSTKFLGHVIDSNGLHIDDNKVKAVRDWP